MTLIKLGAVADDPWIELSDEAPLPSEAPVIVSDRRWLRDRQILSARNTPLGLRLTSDADIDRVTDALNIVVLVVIDFPAFTDGRPFSIARLLRDRFGFTGELRATGQILSDQMPFMQRCGFDSFELASDIDPDTWLEGFSAIGVQYQPASDKRPAAAALRHA